MYGTKEVYGSDIGKSTYEGLSYDARKEARNVKDNGSKGLLMKLDEQFDPQYEVQEEGLNINPLSARSCRCYPCKCR